MATPVVAAAVGGARARDESSDDDAGERASTFEREMREVCRRLARDRELVGDVDARRR